MSKNTLTEFRDTYAGQWPKALSAILFVIIGGHLIAHFFFGAELLNLHALIGNVTVAGICVLFAVCLKRRYPNK